MRRLFLALLLGCVLAPLPGLAESLDFGARTTAEYDDNVFADEDEEEDDVSLRFAPWARIVDDTGRLTGNLRYEPSVEYFTDLDIDTQWEHVARAQLSYQLSAATVISLTDRFARLQSTNRFNEIAIDDGGAAINQTRFDRQRYLRNEVEVDLRHQFSPRLFGVLSATHYLADSQRGIDSESLGASMVLRRVIGAQDRLGIGASWSRQKIDRSDVSDVERTRYYSVFGVWEHDFDARTTLELAAGPSLVDSSSDTPTVRNFSSFRFPLVGQGDDIFFSEFASCPSRGGFSFAAADCGPTGPALPSNFRPEVIALPFVGSLEEPDDRRTTFFANMSLVHRGERWTARASYRRRDSPSAGLGSSTISDTVVMQLSWRPAQHWSTNLSLTATRFTQAQDSQRFVAEVVPDTVRLFTESAESGEVPVEGAARAVAVRSLDVDAESAVLTLAGQLRVERRLTERLSLYGNLFYLDRSADSDLSGFYREYDRFRIVLGVDYSFEPFRF